MSQPLTLLKARGLGEQMQGNMLSKVEKKLDPAKVKSVEVPYSATFGPIGSPDLFAKSLQASVEEGVTNAAGLARSAPGKVAFAGYSFGTLVVEEFVKRYPVGTEIGDKLVLAPTLASARRKEGRSWGLPGRGAGILGNPVDDKRLWIALAWPEDVVTSLPTNSILRRAAPVIQYMSFQDPLKWAESLKKELPKLIFGEIGDMAANALNPLWWERYFDMLVTTGQMIDGYANRGQHTIRYEEDHWFDWRQNQVSAIELIARAINNEVK